MVYRIQVLDGARWCSLGLDCFDMGEVRATLAMLPYGAAYRVRRVSQ